MTAKLTTVSDYEAAIAALDDDERDALKLDEEMHWLLAGGIFCDVFQRRGLGPYCKSLADGDPTAAPLPSHAANGNAKSNFLTALEAAEGRSRRGLVAVCRLWGRFWYFGCPS